MLFMTTPAGAVAPLVTDTKLALEGGPKAMPERAYPRERWGDEELAQLALAVQQGTLFYWNGPQTALLTERFQQHYNLRHVMPCSSGTAAVHIAVAAAGIGPGDEVITSPITDMGTVIGILYQGGVPVFADLGASTYNLDVESVRACITPKTRAIIAVHLTGNPCDLDALKQLADGHNLVLIEDCAQAWGAESRGRPVGTVGHIACYSLNDFKHIGCGDGGIVASNDDRFGPLLQQFGDKAYDRSGGPRRPATLAPNYRISELQSAFAAVQLNRMPQFTQARSDLGKALNAALRDVPGIIIPRVDAADRWTCWFYMFRVDSEVLGCTAAELSAALVAEGLPAYAGYIGEPVYSYPLFQEQNFFNGRWPIKELGLTDVDYTTICCPEAEAILQSCLCIGTHEGYDAEWAANAAAAVSKVAQHFAQQAKTSGTD
jgi:dTDP-4-amino-4,6-dideoxygalactose transaminase